MNALIPQPRTGVLPTAASGATEAMGGGRKEPARGRHAPKKTQHLHPRALVPRAFSLLLLIAHTFAMIAQAVSCRAGASSHAVPTQQARTVTISRQSRRQTFASRRSRSCVAASARRPDDDAEAVHGWGERFGKAAQRAIAAAAVTAVLSMARTSCHAMSGKTAWIARTGDVAHSACPEAAC